MNIIFWSDEWNYMKNNSFRKTCHIVLIVYTVLLCFFGKVKYYLIRWNIAKSHIYISNYIKWKHLIVKLIVFNLLCIQYTFRQPFVWIGLEWWAHPKGSRIIHRVCAINLRGLALVCVWERKRMKKRMRQK